MKLVDLTNFRRKSGGARRAATTGLSKDSSVRVLEKQHEDPNMLWISRSQPNTRGLCGADCSLNAFRWGPVVISRSGT
jgi:hypothetical protein